MKQPRPDHAPGLPGAIVLVGLPETVTAAYLQLQGLGAAAPRVLGAVVLREAGGIAAKDSRRELPVPLLGEVDDLPAIAERLGFKVALVSLPLAMSGAISRVRAALRESGVIERFLPTVADALTHDGMLARPGRTVIDFANLIGRPVRATNDQDALRVIGGRRVLITGAGGSIGSELALRCAALAPSLLVVMDRSENALFEIERQLAQQFPQVAVQRVLHDVVDAGATSRLFREYRPEVVFHAAAHKHVPMMEDHPASAVNNNLFGTKSVADAALEVGTRRFVMVSTDKAVNPTSVMGATKRLAEVYVRSLNRRAREQQSGAGVTSHFSLVRFGNVLGSACSVLPIWSSQIAEGAPITVTHPEMTRYFMSIPEAAALVIQAATVERTDSHGDEVFVLDMGQPIRICDLAERFIRSQGMAPRWEDAGGRPLGGAISDSSALVASIPIRFTGIRPGEKLHEELAYLSEELAPTSVPGILAWSGELPDLDSVGQMIRDLSEVRHHSEVGPVLEAIRSHIPEMRPSIVVCSGETASAA